MKQIQQAERKFHKLIDVQRVVKNVRRNALMPRTLLNNKQRFLMAFQREFVVDESDRTESSDDYTALVNRAPHINVEESFQRAYELLKTYQGKKLTMTDRKLLKGCYTGVRADLEMDNILVHHQDEAARAIDSQIKQVSAAQISNQNSLELEEVPESSLEATQYGGNSASVVSRF